MSKRKLVAHYFSVFVITALFCSLFSFGMSSYVSKVAWGYYLTPPTSVLSSIGVISKGYVVEEVSLFRIVHAGGSRQILAEPVTIFSPFDLPDRFRSNLLTRELQRLSPLSNSASWPTDWGLTQQSAALVEYEVIPLLQTITDHAANGTRQLDLRYGVVAMIRSPKGIRFAYCNMSTRLAPSDSFVFTEIVKEIDNSGALPRQTWYRYENNDGGYLRVPYLGPVLFLILLAPCGFICNRLCRAGKGDGKRGRYSIATKVYINDSEQR